MCISIWLPYVIRPRNYHRINPMRIYLFARERVSILQFLRTLVWDVPFTVSCCFRCNFCYNLDYTWGSLAYTLHLIWQLVKRLPLCHVWYTLISRCRDEFFLIYSRVCRPRQFNRTMRKDTALRTVLVFHILQICVSSPATSAVPQHASNTDIDSFPIHDRGQQLDLLATGRGLASLTVSKVHTHSFPLTLSIARVGGFSKRFEIPSPRLFR